MNPILQAAFAQELTKAEQLRRCGEFQQAFIHLERAHVLGQTFVWPHVHTHWRMLILEWHRGHWLAILGQTVRIMVGALGSAIGILPVGNTGGTNINMFKRLPIDPELQRLIQGVDAKDDRH